MNRTEIEALMVKTTQRVAELGQVAETVISAEERTGEDLGALLTVADEIKALADEFDAAVAGSVGKEARIARNYEKGLRQWSAGARLLCDGLTTQAARLTDMGRQWIEQGSKTMAEAIKALA